MATISRRFYNAGMGGGAMGQRVFGQPFRYTVEYNLPPEIQARRRTQWGWGHMGGRVYSRAYDYSIPTRDEGSIETSTLEFSTASGGVQGYIRTDVQRPLLVSIEFTEDRGGSAGGKMTLSRLPSFPIPPFSVIRLYFGSSGVPIYTGLIKIPEQSGTPKGRYEFELIGFRDQLKTITADQTFSSGQDVGAIVKTIVQNDIAPQSLIGYDSAKINQTIGISIASNLEVHKDNLLQVLDSLADLAGAEWYIDAEGDFVFDLKSTTTQNVFFAGYNVSQIKVEQDINNVVNSWTIKRKQNQASGGAGWTVAAVRTDSTSIAKYGLRNQPYTVPGYFGTTECEGLGDNLLAESAEPRSSAKLTNWQVNSEADLVPRGVYKVVLPFGEYERTLEECDDSADWTLVATGDLTKATDTSIYQTGAASLRLEWTSATGDRVQIGGVDWKGNATRLKFYAYGSRTGELLQFGVGNTVWDDYTWNFAIPVANRFYEVSIDVDALDITSIGFVGFKVLDSSAASTVYIDDIRVLEKNHKHYEMRRERVKYTFAPGMRRADIELGPQPKRSYEWIQATIKIAETADNAAEIR